MCELGIRKRDREREGVASGIERGRDVRKRKCPCVCVREREKACVSKRERKCPCV